MTDNEIMREPNHINRIADFKKRAKNFFATYENSSGGEDCLEVCLIRDGCRAVSQAEETIDRQKAEIEQLYRKQDYVDNFARELCRNRMLNGKAIVSFDDLKKYIEDQKAEAVKEFAKYVKEIDGNEFINEWYESGDLCYEFENDKFEAFVDKLVEEKVGDTK